MAGSPLLEWVFSNTSSKMVRIWMEPVAYDMEVPPQYEYKLLTYEKSIRMEFEDEQITFWMETELAYALYQRPIGSKNWELEIDLLDI